MRVFLVLLLCFLFPAFGVAQDDAAPSVDEAGKPREMPRVVMARVGEHEITVEDFMQFLARHPSRLKEATTTDGKANLLRALIADELLKQAMVREGLVPAQGASPEDYRNAFPQLEAKHFPIPERPDDKALKAYYEAHRDTFGIPASVRLSQIQFRVKDKDNASDAAKAVVRERAEAALKRLEAGEPFSVLATELSENPRSRDNEGDVGFVWRYGDEWLEKALDGLTVGEHTAVLDSPVGYDILLITDAREAIITPFEDARDDVANRMLAEQQMAARNDYVRQLSEEIGVEIVLEELQGSYPDGIFPSGQ